MIRNDLPNSLRRKSIASKVPEITIMFWVVKLLTTAMGENASDYLLHTNEKVGLWIGAGGFVATLTVQFCMKRYQPIVYWSAVSMVAVAGTMAADQIHERLGISLTAETCAGAALLAAVLIVWYRSEGTLSIHSITTRRREVFYWLAVSCSFALGTAAGDLTADTLGLGFLGSIVLFAIIMIVPALGHWKFRLNSVVAFWFAYILTRPLGASTADWMGKGGLPPGVQLPPGVPPPGNAGLGLGDGPVALALLSLIAILVASMTVMANRKQSSSALKA